MKTICTILLILSCSISYGQDADTGSKEMDTETARKDRKPKTLKAARLYRRANSVIKKELHFVTIVKSKLA